MLFEIDGFGSAYLSDDANVPNLLALPYLGGVDSDDDIMPIPEDLYGRNTILTSLRFLF